MGHNGLQDPDKPVVHEVTRPSIETSCHMAFEGHGRSIRQSALGARGGAEGEGQYTKRRRTNNSADGYAGCGCRTPPAKGCVGAENKDVDVTGVSEELDLVAVGSGVVYGEKRSIVGQTAEASRDEQNAFGGEGNSRESMQDVRWAEMSRAIAKGSPALITAHAWGATRLVRRCSCVAKEG